MDFTNPQNEGVIQMECDTVQYDNSQKQDTLTKESPADLSAKDITDNNTSVVVVDVIDVIMTKEKL